ncbi:MAG: TonB-dependent receptor [Proteobacteria bacterium]|nr:TonB-dependent receptor [Pseudomonadota bacterium]
MHTTRRLVLVLAVLILAVLAGTISAARAQTADPPPLPSAASPPPISSPPTSKTGDGVIGASNMLPAVTVTAPSVLENEPTDAASERRISGETLNARPISRPAEVLEATPGLIVTQHSGEGKANQYFLRGFNLDHGTDIAIWLDGMPVNMRTHAHGQGYADLNFLLPELLQSLVVRKGPYWAQEGDFSSAGALHLAYATRLEKDLVSATGGSFGYWRGLAAGTMPAGDGYLTGAGEIVRYDGPWTIPDAMRKYNGIVRYSEGTEANGFAITGMAYTNSWHSTDQIPQRAVYGGLIGLYGAIDPTDGGDSQRYSLSAHWNRRNETTDTRIEGYFVYSTLNLYNNFTYWLNDPVNGDQFQQADKRRLMGVNASHIVKHSVLGHDSESMVGLQLRYDQIDLGLFNTFQRTPLSTIRTDYVVETSAGLYYQNKTKWNDWLRSIAGFRGDVYWASDSSSLAGESAQATAFIPQPKAGLIFGPFDRTEFYLNAGIGFHSNDVRGLGQQVPMLAASRGAEIGTRTQAIRGLDSALAVFVLSFDSELVFGGDSGDTSPTRPSQRVGIEWTNRWQVTSWALLDADFAYTHARYTGAAGDTPGDFIPGAPALVASAGVTLGGDTGWFGALRWRYFGARPLTEDGSVYSTPSSLVDARLGYAFANGLKFTLDAFNVLNTQADQISYSYASRLPGEPAAGVNDVHFHPAEPFALRFTVAKAF